MTVAEFDLDEWAFLPPLDEASLPDEPPVELVLVEWAEPAPPAMIFADPEDSALDREEAFRTGLAWRQPGVAELARLVAVDYAELGAADRIGVLADLQRQQAWLSARQLALLNRISAGDPSQKHWCVEEVGCALGLSGPAAQNLVKNAEQLCRRLPATFTALSEGRIGAAQATVLTEASYQLPPGVLGQYEDQVLPHAHQQSAGQLRRTAKRTVLRLDPATAEARHQRAVADRQVRIAPAEHGTAWLMALLPAAQARLLYDRVDAAARTAPATDPRTMDQRRADTLVNAVLTGTPGDLPTAHGHQPAINVIVALSTLTGHDQEPGWLDGYGPITAGYARQLAHDPTGTWRRLITDPATGQLLDYGTTRYRPPQHLTDHIITRDGDCSFPFCTHPARRCDLDHLTAYPTGTTSADNLQPLHRRHHNAKTQAGWQAHRNPTTATTHWTSPTGRHYTTKPPQRWPLPQATDSRRSPAKATKAPPCPTPATKALSRAALATEPPPF